MGFIIDGRNPLLISPPFNPRRSITNALPSLHGIAIAAWRESALQAIRPIYRPLYGCGLSIGINALRWAGKVAIPPPGVVPVETLKYTSLTPGGVSMRTQFLLVLPTPAVVNRIVLPNCEHEIACLFPICCAPGSGCRRKDVDEPRHTPNKSRECSIGAAIQRQLLSSVKPVCQVVYFDASIRGAPSRTEARAGCGRF